MKSNKNIVLLGMMGSGKSTIGYLLSKKMNFQFFDIDKIIEKEEGIQIKDIFSLKGESYFRKVEEKITLKSLKNIKSVVSLGGGAFLNKRIREEVLAKHFSFWLNLNNTTIIKRIKNSKNRPKLINLSENQLKKLIIERDGIYSKAKFKINCEKLNKSQIVKLIINNYDKS